MCWMYKNLTVPLNPAFAHQFLYCGFQSIGDKSDSVYFRKSMNLFVIQNIVGHVFSLLCRLRMDLVRGKILLWRWCLPWERSRSAPSRTLAPSNMRLLHAARAQGWVLIVVVLARGLCGFENWAHLSKRSAPDAALYMKTCHYLSGFLFVMNDILVVLGVEKVCSAIKTVYNIFWHLWWFQTIYSFYFLVGSSSFPHHRSLCLTVDANVMF